MSEKILDHINIDLDGDGVEERYELGGDANYITYNEYFTVAQVLSDVSRLIDEKQDKISESNKLPYRLLSGTPTIPSEVTESTVSGWGFTKNTGTYSKPSGGIPKSDLASAVQTSLGKADTALQSHQDISGKVNKSGDTLTGALSRSAGGGWISGRDNAVVKQTKTSAKGNDWHPVISVKTSVGNWTMGSVGGETLLLSYDTDDNYSKGSNKSATIYFPDAGSSGILALTSQIPTSLPANGGTSAACSGNSATATTAAKLGRNGSTSTPMTFNWSGQSGQPSWLWGGSDGTNMYVYNPSNFSVNYAKSAGGVAWGNVSSKPSGIACLRSNGYTGSSDNLNSVESTGVYRMSNGSSNPNAILVVFSPVDTCVAQLLFAYDGTTYSRVKWYTNAWTSWKKLTP